MTTTTCSWNVDWNQCANCARLKKRVDNADAAARTASERVDQTYDEYRAERDAGRAVIYTSQWLAWRDRIGNLEQALDEAHATWTAAIDEWAASIRAHRRLHEARQQEAEDSKGVAADTDEMAAIRKDAAVDALVNIYGGHIDKWLEALRERTGAQTDADDDTEAAEKEDETARELFGELRYGDVPDFDLPDDFEDGSWVSLHSASVAVRVYMILLERYAPRAAKGYPAWVANRLRDVLDEAAIQRAITDQGGRR